MDGPGAAVQWSPLPSLPQFLPINTREEGKRKEQNRRGKELKTKRKKEEKNKGRKEKKNAEK
jgi:hypothetical protein